jgi:hypothetical protein
MKNLCTTGKERRITRAEDEHVLEDVQRRLDADPQAMRRRALAYNFTPVMDIIGVTPLIAAMRA